MLLTFPSSLRFSASICASLLCSVVLVACPLPDICVPFCRRPPSPAGTLLEFAKPDVAPLFGPSLPVEGGVRVVELLPEPFAVPTVLFAGTSGALAALPAPLGSFPELFNPPTLAGPFGTPLTPAVPAPAAPAFGEPAGLVAPLVGPLAAPVAAEPPADAPPPEELPPLPPPPLCARAGIVPQDMNNAKAIIKGLFMANSLIS
jgi:hypothetical protein